MRVAAIYDIHGNLPALEKVLQSIEYSGVEKVVVGGDVVPGPMPRECIAALLEFNLPVLFIRGNGEDAVLSLMGGTEYPGLPEQAREAIAWTAQQLNSDHQRIIASWPETVRIQVDTVGEVLFCHATPRNNTEIFTKLTPERILLPLFEQTGVGLVICGHTHMQFDRRIGDVRVVNAGSIGMPFGEPGAAWVLLGPDVELKRTTYDLGGAAERVRGTSYPQAEEFAVHNILQPPQEAQMVELFTRAGLK